MTALRHSFTHIKGMPPAFWVVIAAVLINQLGNMAIAFLVLYLTVKFGFPLPWAAFAYACCCGALLISGIFAGIISDRFGSVKVMATALSLNAIVLLCFPLVKNFVGIVFMCIVWGTVFGLFRPSAQTFLSHISPRESYKVTFSIYRLANNLGATLGPAVGGYLATRSFSLIFFANGVANILATIILVLGLAHKTWITHSPLSSQIKIKESFLILIHDHTLRIFLLGMLPVSMVFFQLSSSLPYFLHQVLHFPLSFYGLLFTFSTLLIVFFELPLNIATLSWSAAKSLMVGSLLIGIGYAAYSLASQEWHILFLTAIWTAGEIILFPAANAFAAEIASENHRGNYMSLFATSTNLGMLLGPWSGAMVMHHFSPTVLWLFCGGLAILSILIFNLLRKK